jgi:hypothetical protein
MYGEDGMKDDLYYEMKRFLESHTIDELLRVLADVVED